MADRALASLFVLAACGARPPPTTPAPSAHGPASLGDALRRDAHGAPVFLANNSSGVAAYAVDGALLRQLTSDGSRGTEVDTRRELLFVTDEPGDALTLIDLREPAPRPVVVARGLAGNRLWSDGGRAFPGDFQIRWSVHPGVDFAARPCRTDEEFPRPCSAAVGDRHRDDDLRATSATIKLVGAAWITANASRPLRPPRPRVPFVHGRASLAPRPYEVVAGRYCEHDCMATCLIHDPQRDRWLMPRFPDAWSDEHDADSGDGLCELDFDVDTQHWFNGAQVCTYGEACAYVADVRDIVGWLDPGLATAQPAVEQR